MLAIVGSIAGLVATLGTVWSGQFGPPPPPPVPPCGVWPYDNPCGRCAYGNMRWPNGSIVRHKVRKGETCGTIGKLYGVPAFDMFNRNKSRGCCQLGDANTSLTDILDICAPPNLEQWRAAGHPRQPVEKGVILSYLGASPGGRKSPNSLPPSINVVALGSAADNRGANGAQGHFRVSPEFPGNCSCQIDPTATFRGMAGGPNGMTGSADSTRVWLASMIPGSYQQWSGNPDTWGKNAAESLAQIILRYRLDGIDINIENPNFPNFPGYICSLSRQLKQYMGADVVVSVTPYRSTASRYAQVAAACPENITIHNYQTYSDHSFNPGAQGTIPSSLANYADKVGWNKTTWGISTQIGHMRPPVDNGLALQRHLQQLGHKARGAFVWTAETSAECKPAWCFEDLLGAVMNGCESPATARPTKCKC